MFIVIQFYAIVRVINGCVKRMMMFGGSILQFGKEGIGKGVYILLMFEWCLRFFGGRVLFVRARAGLGNRREELGNERERLGNERERLDNERERLGN